MASGQSAFQNSSEFSTQFLPCQKREDFGFSFHVSPKTCLVFKPIRRGGGEGR